LGVGKYRSRGRKVKGREQGQPVKGWETYLLMGAGKCKSGRSERENRWHGKKKMREPVREKRRRKQNLPHHFGIERGKSSPSWRPLPEEGVGAIRQNGGDGGGYRSTSLVTLSQKKTLLQGREELKILTRQKNREEIALRQEALKEKLFSITTGFEEEIRTHR